MLTKLSRSFVLGALTIPLLVAGPAAAVPIFVGQWQVDNGPNWTTNPAALSGLQAAALLFGGNPTDYLISTIDNNPANINNLAWYTIWGVAGGTQFAPNFVLDNGNPGYNDPGGANSAASAYVQDNAIGAGFTNFAFIDVAAPEIDTSSVTAPLAFSGILLLLGSRRRRANELTSERLSIA